MKAWLTLRLVLALFSFAVALLTVAPAPTVPLFKLSIGATEFGHWLVLLPLLLLASGPWRGLPSLTAALLSVAASALLLSSAVRAGRYARVLPGELARAFSTSAAETGAVPFAWQRLWFAPAPAPLKMEVHDFAEHDGQKLAFHFYLSQARTPAPCVVVIHGGGW